MYDGVDGLADDVVAWFGKFANKVDLSATNEGEVTEAGQKDSVMV